MTIPDVCNSPQSSSLPPSSPSLSSPSPSFSPTTAVFHSLCYEISHKFSQEKSIFTGHCDSYFVLADRRDSLIPLCHYFASTCSIKCHSGIYCTVTWNNSPSQIPYFLKNIYGAIHNKMRRIIWQNAWTRLIIRERGRWWSHTCWITGVFQWLNVTITIWNWLITAGLWYSTRAKIISNNQVLKWLNEDQVLHSHLEAIICLVNFIITVQIALWNKWFWYSTQNAWILRYWTWSYVCDLICQHMGRNSGVSHTQGRR